MSESNLTPGSKPDIRALLAELGELIRQARQRALRAVDVIQVQTCWELGRHIVEFEQGGAARASYGKRLLSELATALTAEFGKGFDASNLRYMRLFYQAFPIRDALRHELSWTHYRTLLRIDSDNARQWYMNEAATQNWSSRTLERQIGTLYYERLLASQDRAAVEREAGAQLRAPSVGPREFVRDPVLPEFLGFPGAGALLESELEQALMGQNQWSSERRYGCDGSDRRPTGTADVQGVSRSWLLQSARWVDREKPIRQCRKGRIQADMRHRCGVKENQHVDLQKDALRNAVCERIFEGIISGVKTERHGLDAALAYLREGDALDVWKTVITADRLQRTREYIPNGLNVHEPQRGSRSARRCCTRHCGQIVPSRSRQYTSQFYGHI